MRLIDADKMIQSVDMQITIARKFRSNDSQYQEFVSIAEQSIKQEISNAPTVKAIPIELYEQVKGERDIAIEQLKSLNIELFEKPYLKAIPVEWIRNYVSIWISEPYKNFALNMIDVWEKENATEITD